MLASLLALPLFWGFFLWLLPWLEERTLSPEERAETIQRMLEQDSPDEIERRVSDLLANALAEEARGRTRAVSSR